MPARETMAFKNHRILIIDDDDDVRRSIFASLGGEPDDAVLAQGRSLFDPSADPPESKRASDAASFDLGGAANGEAGVAAVRDALAVERPFSVVFTDMQMPGLGGAATARAILEIDPHVKVVIITAYSDQSPEQIVEQIGKSDIFYLCKPFHPAEIRQFARALCAQWRLEREREELVSRLAMEIQAKEAARREAERASGVKDDLISNVSHELKTPLSSIVGFAGTILEEKTMDPQTREEFIRIILTEGNRLGRLIDDLLDIARIESGKIDLQLDLYDIDYLIDGLVTSVAPRFAERAIRLDVRKPTGGIWLTCDPGRIHQALQNLLSNALKFTQSGGTVTLAVENLRDRWVTIRVEDTGLGIPSRDLPYIFEKFYRVDRPGEQIQGTGLGLAITQAIVVEHGGRVTVTSPKNQGTTFTMIFPAGRS